MKGAYSTRHDGRFLRLSAVAFVDLLGFKNKVIEADKTEDSRGTSSELLQHVRQFIRTWRRALRDRPFGSQDRSRSWEVRIFSDSMAISHPITLQELSGDFEMGSLLSQISLLQLGAITEDFFFLRGGLGIGDMFVGRDTVFGVALVEAYRAESCVADVPRIVLAVSAEDFVMRSVGPRPSFDAPYVREVLRDEDGCLFVNYLQSCIQTSGEPPISEWVQKHRDATAEALGRHKENPGILRKYAWVARYHNYWCSVQGLDEFQLEGAGILGATTLERPS